MLIAEMLLVAVDDKGNVPAGSDAFVKVGLTGALLAELTIGGGLNRHIGGSRDRVVDRLVGAGVGRDRPSVLRPTRHPVLDTATR